MRRRPRALSRIVATPTCIAGLAAHTCAARTWGRTSKKVRYAVTHSRTEPGIDFVADAEPADLVAEEGKHLIEESAEALLHLRRFPRDAEEVRRRLLFGRVDQVDADEAFKAFEDKAFKDNSEPPRDSYTDNGYILHE